MQAKGFNIIHVFSVIMSEQRELRVVERDMIVEAHKFGHSVREISQQVNVPRSTFSDVIVKWKRQESAEPNNRSGRPNKLSDKDLQTLKCTVRNNR